jgi:hypothetical protein
MAEDKGNSDGMDYVVTRYKISGRRTQKTRQGLRPQQGTGLEELKLLQLLPFTMPL